MLYKAGNIGIFRGPRVQTPNELFTIEKPKL